MHSLATGFLMREFSGRSDLHPAEAQTLGMIRGLGHWFIQQALRDSADEASTPPFPLCYDGPLTEAATWEEETLHVNHADFGAFVLGRQSLPAALTDPLRNYLRPMDSPRPKASALLRLSAVHATAMVLPDRCSDFKFGPPSHLEFEYNCLDLTPDDFQSRQDRLLWASVL
jgi:hypothetical protein